MSRLIDADEAYKVLTDNYHHRTEIQHKALKEALSKVPTVYADDVVRCKDCRWVTIRCQRHGGFTSIDDYCLGGKKKDDNT